MFNTHVIMGSQLSSFHLYIGFFSNLLFNLSAIIGEELGNPSHQLLESF